MGCSAILFDFNGVLIDDESLHRQLTADLLVAENLPPRLDKYCACCLGRADAACLHCLLEAAGRSVAPNYLDKLVQRKQQAYLNALAQLPELPLFPDTLAVIHQLHAQGVPLGLVSGAGRPEIEAVLSRAGLREAFAVIRAGDEGLASKPDPASYLAALAALDIAPATSLAIEDSLVGVAAARTAGLAVVGVAHTFPLHILQRRCQWVVDDLRQLDWSAGVPSTERRPAG
ncbi:MAG: HAD family phosphatase [Gloeomargaritaceae cyanobacterium C42_A2020_066]|nr:HAD family phosphatase [Gloeomargaritaceae cyanobacterium C42_A2020_066]